MTWAEYNEKVWRAAGLSESQIAKGHARNERVMEPGWNNKRAELMPVKTTEQAIAIGVAVFNYYRSLPMAAKQFAQEWLDAEIERGNRKN